VAGVVVVALIFPLAALPASASHHTGVPSTLSDVAHGTTVPDSPVGKQLTWLLGVGSQLPLSNAQESAHFDATFIAAEPVTKLNEALASLGSTGSTVTLLGVSNVTSSSLTAGVQIGLITYDLQLAVDSTGLIDGLFFSLGKPIPIPKVSSWTQLDKDLKKMAPESSFVAAKLGSDGTCTDVHVVDATTPRPLGSMFKLFILGALANAVRSHLVSWDQKLTVSANIKVGGSGVLQSDPDGTTLTVEQTAVTMISDSDNTAADMLLKLVGRSAVEAEVRSWSSHASLDTPFLSAAEFFALKWDDFPVLANRYLSLSSEQRLSFLTSTIDEIPASHIVATVLPRDINSIEWFSSPDDMCRAFAGLQTLESQPGLGQLSTILGTNNGGIELKASTWPLVWFKGGSEPGVLTLGYLARDSSGSTFVVVMMLENTKKAIAPSSTLLGLGVVTGALNLLREARSK
jgi:beta-lactamase class A